MKKSPVWILAGVAVAMLALVALRAVWVAQRDGLEGSVVPQPAGAYTVPPRVTERLRRLRETKAPCEDYPGTITLVTSGGTTKTFTFECDPDPYYRGSGLYLNVERMIVYLNAFL